MGEFDGRALRTSDCHGSPPPIDLTRTVTLLNTPPVRLKFKVTLPEDSWVVISLDWEVKLIIPKGLSLSRIVIVERLFAEILGDEA